MPATFAELLLREMRATGTTVEALAKTSNVTETTIFRLRRGPQLPTLPVFCRLLKALPGLAPYLYLPHAEAPARPKAKASRGGSKSARTARRQS